MNDLFQDLISVHLHVNSQGIFKTLSTDKMKWWQLYDCT